MSQVNKQDISKSNHTSRNSDSKHSRHHSHNREQTLPPRTITDFHNITNEKTNLSTTPTTSIKLFLPQLGYLKTGCGMLCGCVRLVVVLILVVLVAAQKAMVPAASPVAGTDVQVRSNCWCINVCLWHVISILFERGATAEQPIIGVHIFSHLK